MEWKTKKVMDLPWIKKEADVSEELKPSIKHEVEDYPVCDEAWNQPSSSCSGYICYHCSSEWEELSQLKKHIKKHHIGRSLIKSEVSASIDKSSFHCPLFELTSTEIADSDSKKQKSYKCEYCNFTSVYSSSLRVHISSRHFKNRPFHCSHCSFQCLRAGGLRSHVDSEHKERKKFQCPYCDVAVTRSHTLRDHIAAVHSHERPFACPECNYAAPVSSYLKAHIKAKHSGEKPYKCKYCPYSSVRSNTLQGHIQTRHTNEKPHRCTLCSYSSIRPSFLQEHIRAKHTNERPYACPHCEYSTVRSANLKSHIKTHLKCHQRTIIVRKILVPFNLSKNTHSFSSILH